MEQIIEFIQEFIIEHPEHEDDVNSYYYLMLSEIEAGESRNNEEQLFYSSCKDLLL